MKARNKRYAAILSVVTVLALALSLVAVPTPSYAAAPTVKTSAFSDVAADSAQAPAFNAMAAIGVYTGYPDGTAHPSANITRAEAAAIAVRLAGRAAAAASLATQTPAFKDSVPQWAWGYVNVASSLGIINGYPDGTFRANNPVTQAEFVAMVTRVLGNDAGVKGVWPMKYMIYADQAGLLKGVNPAATVPATRAEAAQIAYNALSVTAKYDAATGAFDRDYAGAPLATLDNSGNLVTNQNPKSYGQQAGFVQKVTLTPSTSLAGTVYLSGASSLAGLYNTSVWAYKSAGATAFGALEPAASGVTTVTGTFSDVSSDGTSITIKDSDGNSLTYPVAGDGNIALQINGGTTYSKDVEIATQLGKFKSGNPYANVTLNLTLTLDQNGTVTAITGSAWNVKGDLTKVTAATSSATSTLQVGTATYSAPASSQLFLDGNPAAASDLANVLKNWNVSGLSPRVKVATTYTGSFTTTVYVANVYSKTVTGKVTSLTSDGTNYYVNLDVNGQTVKVTYDWKTASWGSGNVGQTVTFVVDPSNNGLAVTSVTPAAAQTVQLAKFNSYTESYDTSGQHVIASVTLADGTTKSVTVANYGTTVNSIYNVENAEQGDVLLLVDGWTSQGTVVATLSEAGTVPYVAVVTDGQNIVYQGNTVPESVTFTSVINGFLALHEEWTVSGTTYYDDAMYLMGSNVLVWGKDSNSSVSKLSDIQAGDGVKVYLFKNVVVGIQDLKR